jgi:sensor histidine kinase YesM
MFYFLNSNFYSVPKKQLILSLFKLVLIYFLINSSALICQNLKPIHFGVEDGLPSSIVFSSIEDTRGFMWFATESGVARFDGTNFDIFNVKDGFNSNTILELDEDSKGRIWATPIAGDLSFFENGSWKGSKEYPQLKEPFGKALNRPILICIKDYILGIYNKHILLIYFNKKNEMITEKFWNILDSENTTRIGYKLFHNSLLLKTIKQQITIPTPSNNLLFEKINNPYLIVNHEIIEYNSDFSFKKINVLGVSNYILKSCKKLENELLIACNMGVIKCTKVNDSTYQKSDILLNGENITNLYIDSRKNIWASSNVDGIYLIPKELGNSFYLQNLVGDYLFKSIYLKNKYRTISRDGKLFEFNDLTASSIFNYKKFVYGYDIYYNDEYILLSDKILRNSKDLNICNWNKSITFNPYHNSICLGTGYSVIKVEKNNLFKTLAINDSRNYSILPISKNEILVGSDIGLQILHDTIIKNYELGKYSQLKNITSVIKGKENTIIILASNSGILLKNQDKYILLKENRDLITEANCIFNINENILLVGTQKGLNIVKYETNPLRIIEINALTKLNGLNENNINNINYNQIKNEVILTFNKGIQTIPIKNLLPIKNNAYIYLKSIKSNDSQYFDFTNLRLNSKETSLEISFGSVDYNNESINGYLYQLNYNNAKGNNNFTNSNVIRFSNLVPGKYKLIISFINPYSLSYKNKKTIEFEIKPEFWQTTWFKFLLVLIILTIIILSIYFYLKYTKRKIEDKATLKMQLSDLELEAQKSRLKPHFIFNSLNSIQSYINQNELELANNYLVNFSKLMRQSLDLSSHEITTLKQEFEFTRNYMAMEKVRFNKKFNFEIIMDETLADRKIPSMILQTFVENAINHGLRYKEKGMGLLLLKTLKHDDTNFVISISDNGIGKEKAKIFKKPGHISKGVEIIYQRINLFNLKHGATISIIETSNDINEEEIGHLVTITFKNYTL